MQIEQLRDFYPDLTDKEAERALSLCNDRYKLCMICLGQALQTKGSRNYVQKLLISRHRY